MNVDKIIKHQITTGQTESEVCREIGITARTLYNVRKGKFGGKATIEKINNYILEKGL
jgi:transposase-like protein